MVLDCHGFNLNTREHRCQAVMVNCQSMVVTSSVMAGKTPDTGPTAATVIANLKRLRDDRNLTYTQLSNRLKALAHWSISPVGVRRIEDGERRVTVDDLLAFAVALGVSPVTLLMPNAGE